MRLCGGDEIFFSVGFARQAGVDAALLNLSQKNYTPKCVFRTQVLEGVSIINTLQKFVTRTSTTAHN